MLGGVQRLISHGVSNQAVATTLGTSSQGLNPSPPSQEIASPSPDSSFPIATPSLSTSPPNRQANQSIRDTTAPLWQNFSGLSLKSGDSVIVNGEIFHFHSWGDGLPSIMQVLPLGVGHNLAFLRQIHAHEVWSIAREVPQTTQELTKESVPTTHPSSMVGSVPNSVPSSGADFAALTSVNPNNHSEVNHGQRFSENTAATSLQSSQPYAQSAASAASFGTSQSQLNQPQFNQAPFNPTTSQPPLPEPPAPPEPTPNAWEVWTYLERQRLTAHRDLHTFRAEWEANRFVREAERSAPDHLRVHYEIRPVVRSEAELNSDNPQQYRSTDAPSPAESGSHHGTAPKDGPEIIHDDAIDVEILGTP